MASTSTDVGRSSSYEQYTESQVEQEESLAEIDIE